MTHSRQATAEEQAYMDETGLTLAELLREQQEWNDAREAYLNGTEPPCEGCISGGCECEDHSTWD